MYEQPHPSIPLQKLICGGIEEKIAIKREF
jgi:hypothetical protein